jgi:hypothetical protein
MFILWWYALGNGEKCELQHLLNVSFEKSLDLDYKNELSSAFLDECNMCLPKIHYLSFKIYKIGSMQ